MISIPKPPSPAFCPPDDKTSKSPFRSVKMKLLIKFLSDRAAGSLDSNLLWALFLTNTVTKELDAYFDHLTQLFLEQSVNEA